jgi:hypothetical protein
MRAASLVKRSLAAIALGTIALNAADRACAAPVPSSTVAVKAAAPDQAIAVGYGNCVGACVGAPLAAGLIVGPAVAPFYAPAYYAPYVYYAPPVYYTPLPYYGPPVVYGQPVLGPNPYFPLLYPYVRTTGPYWRHGRYPHRRYWTY